VLGGQLHRKKIKPPGTGILIYRLRGRIKAEANCRKNPGFLSHTIDKNQFQLYCG
jgi:hypothetical protein